MLRLLADENFDNDVVRALLRRNPNIDIVRVQDVGLSKTPDPIILEWAAQEGRVLLTHDVKTITRFAYERVKASEPMPGVFEIKTNLPIGKIIEDILVLVEASIEGEWEGRVEYLPLK